MMYPSYLPDHHLFQKALYDQVDEGLFIVPDDLRIQTIHEGVERSQDVTGG